MVIEVGTCLWMKGFFSGEKSAQFNMRIWESVVKDLGGSQHREVTQRELGYNKYTGILIQQYGCSSKGSYPKSF